MWDGRRSKIARLKEAPLAEIDAVLAAKVEAVPDEILELVFLRLPLPQQLVRAACTCRRWRRIITVDNGRLIRSLHGPPSFHIVGHYVAGNLHRFSCSRPHVRNPLFAPSYYNFSPWEDILAQRNLELNFLPRPVSSGFCWELADSRGGLLLLVLVDQNKDPTPASRILVCDPMSRRYREIPLPPWFHRSSCLGVFLLDGEDAGGYISMSNFMVTSVLYRNRDVTERACIFSTAVAGGGRDTIARACTFSSAGGGHWTSSTMHGRMGNDYWGWDCRVCFTGFGGGGSVAYWRAGNHGVLSFDKDTTELYALPDTPQGELHAPEYTYELSWPPTIQAGLHY